MERIKRKKEKEGSFTLPTFYAGGGGKKTQKGVGRVVKKVVDKGVFFTH